MLEIKKTMIKQKKIIDTVSTFGMAERYLTLDADFIRWFTRSFNVDSIKAIDPEEIIKKYNLHGLVFGNYLTQEERYFYLYYISSQMELLTKLIGNNNIGKGILIVSFGAHGMGKANATIMPRKDYPIINLTRGRKGRYEEMFKGENSFIHEYGHFLDLCQGFFTDKSLSHNFASENTNKKWTNRNTKLFSDVVDVVGQDNEYMAPILFSDYLSKRIELFARLFEACVTKMVREKHPDFNKYFPRNYKENMYYPIDKIKKLGLDNKILKILKTKYSI